MSDPAGRSPSRLPPPAAYVLASALLWAVFTPIVEALTGSFSSLGRSALEGAAVGCLWGSAMFAYERRLERRASRTDP
jgi:hypothetical protein